MTSHDLIQLGLTAAGKKLQVKEDLKRKLTLAYEHFRFVTPQVLDRFKKALKAKTLKRTGKAGWDLVESYDKLKFIPLNQYEQIPPPDCLLDLKKAQEIGCFDAFEVAKIQAVVERKDPILFGTIVGCQDKFFVTQWDDDLKIEDILKDNEG